jgi:hypothetical protein
MTLQSLREIIEPPAAPVESADWEAWPSVDEELDVQLPEDYKCFLTIFGTGSIGSFLWVLNPFSSNKYLNLLQQMKVSLERVRALQTNTGDSHPYSLYPNAGGLLPWAITDNGDTICWRTLGPASNWNVVIVAARGPNLEQYPYGMSEFLRALIVGEIQSQIIPRDLLDLDRLFVPLRSQSTEQE